MKLQDIVVEEAPGESESLALCLRAVAAAAGVPLDYDDLCAALGVSFAAVSCVQQSSPGWWMTFGRDAFLTPAARLFGIELRDLHPPDVAVDMVSADEFGQHFELSYKPLISRALENGQPVIAWQGWPQHYWAFWGVITGIVDGAFQGTTMWSEGQPRQLVEPALQCYVVERCDPGPPMRDTLLRTAVDHADGYLNRAPYAPVLTGGPAPRIITGPAAFDAWEEWLQSCGDAAGELWNEHRQHSEFIATSRESAARFLRRMLEVAPPQAAEEMAGAIDCCERAAGRLAPSRDVARVQSSFGTRQGREELYSALTVAEADDRRLAMHIENLRSALAARV